ncbi:MAG: hypothetical protein IPK82_16425 [Polyangiaceae bacterium]|nr:hypothetical protein [Polyangiaceae bacterium]
MFIAKLRVLNELFRPLSACTSTHGRGATLDREGSKKVHFSALAEKGELRRDRRSEKAFLCHSVNGFWAFPWL